MSNVLKVAGTLIPIYGCHLDHAVDEYLVQCCAGGGGGGGGGEGARG